MPFTRDSNPIRAAKRRMIRWLAAQLQAEQVHEQVQDAAIFGPGAVLAPEGRIENNTRETQCIVLGAHSFIRGRLLTHGHGGRITLGEWCYLGPRSEIWSMDEVRIGNRVLIAHDVNIHDHTAHSLDAEERHAHFRHILERGHPRRAEDLPGVRWAPVIIEDDVWISFGVTILKGVRIGTKSVIAAGSLVTRDVPAGVFYRNEAHPVITPLPAHSEVTPSHTRR